MSNAANPGPAPERRDAAKLRTQKKKRKRPASNSKGARLRILKPLVNSDS